MRGSQCAGSHVRQELSGFILLEAPHVIVEVSCVGSLVVIEGSGEHAAARFDAAVQWCNTRSNGQQAVLPVPSNSSTASMVYLGAVLGVGLGVGMVAGIIALRRHSKAVRQRKRLPTWVAVTKP